MGYIQILGCYSASMTLNKHQSSQVLFHKNQTYLIDCGEATQALINKQECEIRDFGSFRLSKLKANAHLRNPLTNQLIYRPERVKLRFKASKKINKLINE